MRPALVDSKFVAGFLILQKVLKRGFPPVWENSANMDNGAIL